MPTSNRIRLGMAGLALVGLLLLYFILHAQNPAPQSPTAMPPTATTSAIAQATVIGQPPRGSASAGNISITDSYVQATIPYDSTAAPTMAGMSMTSTDMATTTAVYMTIHNNGNQPDTLVAVSTDAAKLAVLHQTIVQNNVAQMLVLPAGLIIPANSSVALKPGGYHVMLSQLKTDLAPGDTVTLTFKFQSGTTITLIAPVVLP